MSSVSKNEHVKIDAGLRAYTHYRTLSSWLKTRFGEQVRKISVDAGLGCPNRDGTIGVGGCIFCNPRGSGTGALLDGYNVARQIDLGIEKLSGRFRIRKFIAYFQSYTNTYAPVERLSEIYDAACEREEIVGIAVGTRPDCVPDGVLRLLADIATRKPVWVEYGLQSIHARTLELINRGHGPDAFFDAVRRTASYDLPVVAHLILGLPGETVEDMRETARVVGRSGVWGVKLHHLYVIEGSRLARLYHEGLYRPMTLDEAVDAVCAVLEELPPEVVIHRLTSDPHREELVAPQWMTARSEVRQAMDHALKKRNLRQGSALGV